MKKRLILGMAFWASLQCGMAQSLEKMQWFNEPEQWKIENQTLTMYVTPQSDYWRISHYGFTVDDAPFYYATYGGEFEVTPAELYGLSGRAVREGNFACLVLLDWKRETVYRS